MRTIKRVAAVLGLTAALLLAGTPVAAMAGASHGYLAGADDATVAGRTVTADGDVAIQATCYGGAVSFSTDAYFEWPSGSWAVTGPYCSDINIKSNRAGQVWVCIYGAASCSGPWWAPAGEWKVIKYDVPDGTLYYIKTDRWMSGLIAD